MLKKLFSSSSSKKRRGGCGGCGNPKPEDIIEPKPKARSDQTHGNQFTSNVAGNRVVGAGVDNMNDDFSITMNAETSPLLLLSDRECDPNCTKTTSSPSAKVGDSIVVVKDSDDPYRDFQMSMLQMIRENRIYSNDDLQELLECFLRLNSSSHHHVIIQAFTEIWDYLSGN